jgi:hypothetical protein
MSQTVEIARFRVDPDAEEGLLAAWPPMVDAMKRAHPALESVRLVRFGPTERRPTRPVVWSRCPRSRPSSATSPRT